jgi:prepilin-type N-terminal cleavage/methylation domain-containing protein
MSNHRVRAFSIVELMVVMVIIAVLMGILFPVLSHARAASRRTGCLANLRTLGIALQEYHHSRGSLPLAPSFSHVPSGEDRLIRALESHLDAPPVRLADGVVVTGQPWACPADRTLAPAMGASYEYAFAPLLRLPSALREILPNEDISVYNAKSATRRFFDDRPQDRMLMLDLYGWHPGRPVSVVNPDPALDPDYASPWTINPSLWKKGWNQKNMLRGDGSVDWTPFSG